MTLRERLTEELRRRIKEARDSGKEEVVSELESLEEYLRDTYFR